MSVLFVLFSPSSPEPSITRRVPPPEVLQSCLCKAPHTFISTWYSEQNLALLVMILPFKYFPNLASEALAFLDVSYLIAWYSSISFAGSSSSLWLLNMVAPQDRALRLLFFSGYIHTPDELILSLPLNTTCMPVVVKCIPLALLSSLALQLICYLSVYLTAPIWMPSKHLKLNISQTQPSSPCSQ